MDQNSYQLHIHNFTEQYPSWEAVFVTCTETPIILRYTKIHYQFQRVLSMILSWARWVQFMLAFPVSLRLMLIFSSHVGLVCASGLLPLGFPIKTPHTPLLFHILATWPSHLIILDFITRTIMGEKYRSLSSLLCSFLHSHVTSSFLGQNILFSTLFSNTLSLRSFLYMSN